MGIKEEMAKHAEVTWITTTAFSSESIPRSHRIRESKSQTTLKEQLYQPNFRVGEQGPGWKRFT